ncbi:hypothetical protein Y032_0393g612 [Ancylostoma ceylanicum]|uniref:Uncharacterized protein n=1 Tax=Ancylostoma ceylanicum TaxID=53326 RepID=A0A016RT01_9BILA|nr:hypothetical protein Y032_0393g612 [Ancylostoma ceylanicum]
MYYRTRDADIRRSRSLNAEYRKMSQEASGAVFSFHDSLNTRFSISPPIANYRPIQKIRSNISIRINDSVKPLH